jgi:hypothetical protein
MTGFNINPKHPAADIPIFHSGRSRRNGHCKHRRYISTKRIPKNSSLVIIPSLVSNYKAHVPLSWDKHNMCM